MFLLAVSLSDGKIMLNSSSSCCRFLLFLLFSCSSSLTAATATITNIITTLYTLIKSTASTTVADATSVNTCAITTVTITEHPKLKCNKNQFRMRIRLVPQDRKNPS